MHFKNKTHGLFMLGCNNDQYYYCRYDGSNDLTTGEYYNPAANVWSPTTPMGTRRSCLGICAYDGLIYCVGGYDGASCLSSVERYDPLTAMWTSCPAMSTKRRYCRSVVLGTAYYSCFSLLKFYKLFIAFRKERERPKFF